MFIDRRSFLLGSTAVLAVSQKTHAGFLHRGGSSSGPGAATGRINLDLAGPDYFDNVWQFIDITKGAQAWTVTSSATVNGFASGIQFVSSQYQGTDTPIWSPGTTIFQPSSIGVFQDSNGDFLTTMPSGTMTATRALIVNEMPPDYANVPMTVTFNNNGGGYTVTLSADGTVCSGTTSPLTGMMPASAQTVTLTVTGSGNNPPQQIVVQKSSSLAAGLIAGGSYIDPLYASTTAQGAWSLRMMNWMGASYANQTTYNASSYPSVANGGWGYGQVNGSIGMPLAVQVSAAKQMNKNLWTNLTQGVFSKIATVTNITNANPGVVVLNGPCPFVNGETIYFPNGLPLAGPQQVNPTSFASSTFTGTGVAALANNTPVVFGALQNTDTPDSSTYPTGITKGTTYWVVNANQSAGTWQIATTPGGTALTLTGTAPSTINVLVNKDSISTYGQIINPTYATGTWTLANHGIPNGAPCQFGIAIAVPLSLNNVDTSTYPTGMSKKTQYYIVNGTTNTFQISATIGGSALSLSGSLTGTANMALYLAGAPFTVSGVSGNTFQLNGLSTAGFVGNAHPNESNNTTGGWNVGGEEVFVFKGYNLTDTLANVGGIAAYLLANMPSNLIALYEFGNEIWNGAYSTREQIQLLGTYQSALSSPGLLGFNPYANGYIQAAVAYALYQAYGSANRARYQFVLGSNWTGLDALGGPDGVIAGAQQFLTDNSLTETLNPVGASTNYLFDFVSMTTYTGSSYTTNGDTPTTVSFGTNTISFPSGLQKFGGGAITDALVTANADPWLGLPIKLNTNSPGGTLPSGLVAGTLASSGGSSAGTIIATINGNVLTYSAVSLFGPNTNFPVVVAGMTLVCPDLISPGTTINAYSSGGTNGNGGLGTYQLSASQATLTTPTMMTVGYPAVQGTGTIYWLVGSAPNFGLATSPGGSPVSFSGGSGTNTAVVCSTDVVQYLINESLSLHNSSPGTYPNAWTYFGTQIGQDCISAKWTGGQWYQNSPVFPSVAWTAECAQYYITNYLASGKALAGVRLIAYEGGNNNSPIGIQAAVGNLPIPFVLYCDPSFVSAYTYEQFSSGQADTTLALFTQLVSTGLMYKIAQFLDSGAFTIQPNEDNYGARQFIGDNNPRWAGIVSINGM